MSDSRIAFLERQNARLIRQNARLIAELGGKAIWIAQCEAGEPIRPSEEDMMYTPPVRRHAHIWPAPRGARVEREVEEKENEGKANDSDMA